MADIQWAEIIANTEADDCEHADKLVLNKSIQRASYVLSECTMLCVENVIDYFNW